MERNTHQFPLVCLWARDQTHNPGMCPNQLGIQQAAFGSAGRRPSSGATPVRALSPSFLQNNYHAIYTPFCFLLFPFLFYLTNPSHHFTAISRNSSRSFPVHRSLLCGCSWSIRSVPHDRLWVFFPPSRWAGFQQSAVKN